jgi:ElaB/YqjD/DUF883 family membrane-anchored ribosome-binding protein
MTQTQDLADKVRTGDTEGLRNTVSDAAEQARKRAQEFGKQAKERVDQSRAGAADAMDNTAEKIGKAGAGSAGKMAEGLHSAAKYVRSNDVGSMMSDLGGAIKNNPVPAMITAVAFGFVIGAMMRRD